MDNIPLKSCSFDFYLKVYPVTFLERSDLEKGDKILLPPTILNKISSYEVEGPIMFELSNNSQKRRSHCGVMDFTADEGCAYLPNWMMQNIGIKEGERVNFKYASLEKGNYVKLQPQTDDFLKISNPKAVLEAKLRYFTCLTKFDVIAIDYNNKIYWINVLDVKPGNAISIIDTDIDVDFAPPLVSKKPEQPTEALDNSETSLIDKKKEEISHLHSEEISSEEEENLKKSFGGKGHTVQ